MNKAEQIIAWLGEGMTLVESVGGASALGRSTMAKNLTKLHEVYYGKTRYKTQQAQARTTKHSFETLLKIEGKLRSLNKKNKKQAWNLRRTLCFTPAHKIDEVAAEKLAELCPKPAPKKGVSMRQGKEHSTLRIDGDTRSLADVWALQDGTLETFLKTFFDGNAKPDVGTRVIMKLDERIKILEGKGDDIVLQMTNGATMTGAEWVAENLHRDEVVVGLFHPLSGPVRAYQERFASGHQREMCLMENPTCAWPKCNKPGIKCQFHHMKPFVDGGETSIDNLVTLCEYHNRRNSDRGPNRNGRMMRIGAATCWVSPYGRIVRTGMWAEPPPDLSPPDLAPPNLVPA